MAGGDRRRVLKDLAKRVQARITGRKLVEIELERFPPGALESGNRIGEETVRFHWDLYSSLRYQRASLSDEIRAALISAASPLSLTGWRRLVQYTYSDEPLSSVGSLRNEVGGRFNIGALNPHKYSPFPALYLASDVPTCLVECFPPTATPGEDALTYALRTDSSFTCISITGELDSVVDLRDGKSLQAFVDVIRHLQVPVELVRRAEQENFSTSLVRTVENLQKALAARDWRRDPLITDVPAPSQVFGELAYQAGIEGVLYDSVRGDGQCVAVFPKNLSAGSFVEIAGSPPNETVICRLDSSTWQRLT